MHKKLLAMALIVAATPACAADVQLLLVRDAVSDPRCDVPVFRGRLYAVPPGTRLDSVATPAGLEMLTHVQELPYEDNAEAASSIPVGEYSATVRTDPTKPWMTGSRSWRLELIGVPKRKFIQFHYGPDPSWSSGCIILTGAEVNMCTDEPPSTPDAAVHALKSYVESTMVSSADKIRVRVVEWPGA